MYKKKNIIVLLFIIFILLSIACMIILPLHCNSIKGGAIEGKIENGKYYVMALKGGVLIEVKIEEWLINFFLWIISLFCFLSTAILLITVTVKYLMLPAFDRLMNK
jgi:hypothetical protein